MAATYAELRQRIVEGDTTVTPAQLDDARRRAEFDAVKAEADTVAAERQREAEYLAGVEQLRTDAADLADRLPSLTAAYRAAVDAVRDLQAGLAGYHHEQRQIVKRARYLDAVAAVDTPPVLDPERTFQQALSDAAGRAPERLHVLHDDDARRIQDERQAAHAARIEAENERVAARRADLEAQKSAPRSAAPA